MVKRSGEDEEIDYTLMIRPFSPSVWYALCSARILHSVLMLFTEHPDWYNAEAWEGASDAVRQRIVI